MSIPLKEPLILQLEEQERKFSPKRRHKEEENEEDDNELDQAFQHKDKAFRLDFNKPAGEVEVSTTSAPKNAYEIPCIFGPAPTNSTSAGSSQRGGDLVLPSSDRSSRNIAFLCARIAEELKKKGPQTRDELSATTGFARQRICTVISVFKAIGLVNIRDSNTRRSEIEWNEHQAKILPNVSTHVNKLLNLRTQYKELREKEQDLVKKILEKRQNMPSTQALTAPTLTSLPLSSSSSLGSNHPLLSLLSPSGGSTLTVEDDDKFPPTSSGPSASKPMMDHSLGLNKATEGF